MNKIIIFWVLVAAAFLMLFTLSQSRNISDTSAPLPPAGIRLVEPGKEQLHVIPRTNDAQTQID